MGCGPSKVVSDCRSSEKWNVLLSQLQHQADADSLLVTTHQKQIASNRITKSKTSINSGSAPNRSSICTPTSPKEQESNGIMETINIVDLMDGLLHDDGDLKKVCPPRSDPEMSKGIKETFPAGQRSLSREHNLSFGRFCQSERFEYILPSVEASNINIRSKDDSDKPTLNNSINFALRALSFRFALDEEASLKLFNHPAADLISPSLPPSLDFCTSNSRNPMRHPAPDLSVSEESYNPLTTKNSPFLTFSKERLVQINAPLQDDDTPFFDPDLLDSLEMALQHSTEEEWNAGRNTDQELQQYDIGMLQYGLQGEEEAGRKSPST